MQKFSRKSLFIGLVAISMLFTASAWGGLKHTIEKSFDVSPGGLLTVETELGALEIVSSSSNRVEIEIVIDSRTRNDDRAKRIFDDFEVQFEQDGDNVDVYAEYFGKDRNGWSFFGSSNNRRPEIKFTIAVPKQYDINVETHGGSIYVGTIEGKVKTRTSGGSLHFEDIKGPVDGRTSGGSITLESCVGYADVKTSGGSITIGRVEGDVNARTSGGSVRVEEVMGVIDASTSGGSMSARISRQPTGDCRLTTSGGSVTVYLAEELDLDIDAKTSHGRVRSDLPIDNRSRRTKKSSLRGELGDGGPELYLRTSGGTIKILEL